MSEAFCEIPPVQYRADEGKPLERQRRHWTRSGRASAWWDFFVNEVVLPEHLFHICTILGPTRSYHFSTF